jgi:hypothetical protein
VDDDCLDTPKSLRRPECLESRLERLRDPHILPLTEYVDRLRATLPDPQGVPYFDPADGGVNARVMLLLEAPGRMAAANSRRRGSGLVSCNNDDESARVTIGLLRDAGGWSGPASSSGTSCRGT